MKEWILVVERIEGITAVLETQDGETFPFPAALLPDGVGEGAYLRFTINNEPKLAENARQSMADLRQSLLNKTSSDPADQA